MEKETEEQYLKTLLSLSEEGKPVKTTDLAKSLGVVPATVTEGLQKLAGKALVKYEAYHGASLTSKGRKIAQKISRKHRLLERFLTDVLGFEPSKVHKQACEMEHTLSDEATIALCRALNHPDICPDDNKAIPPCGLDVESCVECQKLAAEKLKSIKNPGELKQLTDLEKGEKARIQFIRGGENVVEKLHNMGLTRGTEIEMTNSAPFSGPVEVCARGCKLVLGRVVANKIFVQP